VNSCSKNHLHKPHSRGTHALRAVLWLGLLLIALSNAPRLLAQAVNVEVHLEPGDVLGLDELALLRIKIEGGNRRGDPLPKFELENLEIHAGPSQSTSLTILNGVPTSSLTYSWHLRPLAVGKGRVYNARLRSGDEVRQLPQREVEIVEQAPARSRRRRSNDPFGRLFSDPFFNGGRLSDAMSRRRQPRRQVRKAPEIFLQAVVNPPRPWVGQQALYTLYLFTQADVRSVNPSNLPTYKGFWSREVPQPEQLLPEMVERNGQRFGRVVLLERALFPRRAGLLEIEPAEAQLVALLDSNPFSLMPRGREITRTSNAVQVDVRELPPAPEGFEGVVGEVNLEASLSPTSLEVGEAATLTVTLSGRGHLQGLLAPRLPELPGIQIFPPQQQSEEGLRSKRVTGKRIWSFVLVPEKPGEWQLPAVQVPFFNPRRERYEVASSGPFELLVKGSTSLVQDGGRTVDLHSIRTAALPAISTGSLRLGRARPWLFALPWGIALLLLWRRQSSGGTSGSHHRELLHRLKAASHEARPRQVAALIEDAWRQFLAARWEIPQGTPSTRWGRLLDDSGLPGAAATELVKLADDLHYLRYAPKLSSTEDLQKELVERSRKLVKALR